MYYIMITDSCENTLYLLVNKIISMEVRDYEMKFNFLINDPSLLPYINKNILHTGELRKTWYSSSEYFYSVLIGKENLILYRNISSNEAELIKLAKEINEEYNGDNSLWRPITDLFFQRKEV